MDRNFGDIRLPIFQILQTILSNFDIKTGIFHHIC